MTTTGIVVAAVLAVETFGVLWFWAQKAVPRRYLRWGRNDPSRTALLVLGSHLAWVSVAAALALAFDRAAPVGGDRTLWGLALAPLLAVLGPYSQVWFARWPGDFRSDIEGLVAEGASPETAKAFFWSGAVFAYLAIAIAVVALGACFTSVPTRAEPAPDFGPCSQARGVVATGANPPDCDLVMMIVAEIAADPAASNGGYMNRRVRGFDCNADGGVAVCVSEGAQIAFDVPGAGARPANSPAPKKASKSPSTAEPVMPDLIGMAYLDGAEVLGAALDAAGNDTVIQARTRRTGGAEPGTYLDQSPAPGTILTADTPIKIFVEEGP